MIEMIGRVIEMSEKTTSSTTSSTMSSTMSRMMIEMSERVSQAQTSTLYTLWDGLDTWRLRRARRGLNITILSFCALFAHSFSSPEAHLAHADEVNEFDEGSDGWTAYPSTMGRSSESGWVNVTNDGEGSIRNLSLIHI